jgi:acyl transferase domain-containing protein/acyl carrier protein
VDQLEASIPELRASEAAVAVIGLSVRVPGARTVDEFWANLRSGRVTIRHPSLEELKEVDAKLTSHPRYVAARGAIEAVEEFDLAFWSMTPREAEIIDPQQRVFLECCYEAMEDAGYAEPAAELAVGVYGSSYLSTYLLRNLLPNQELVELHGMIPLHQGNAPDQLASRVAYKLGFTGPAITVQTACSSSLVAVHLAVQSLLTGESDIALAGGVSIVIPQEQGYVHTEGGLLSEDGVCRPFDRAARGTVFSNGAGVVALKRLGDAVRDGDHIYAVIVGSAVNNDGSDKAAYAAPGLEGHARVVRDALGFAGVTSEQIGYVEAHGTGTELGDAVEVAALAQVFGTRGHAVLGSVKGNIGHLDNAAGVASFIKAVLAVHTGTIPGTANFVSPNDKLELGSTFRVTSQTERWSAAPRLAGVSALGMGGTNAHVVLAAAENRRDAKPASGPQLLVLSAKSETALATLRLQLAERLERAPALALQDVALTLARGRRAFEWRWAAVCEDRDDAIAALRSPDLRPRRCERRAGPNIPGARAALAPQAPVDRAAPREFLRNLGNHWASGGAVDWAQVYADTGSGRVPLPTYPFERQRCWVEANTRFTLSNAARSEERCHEPYWMEVQSVADFAIVGRHNWLVFVDGSALSDTVVERLRAAGQIVITAERGSGYEAAARHHFRLNAESDEEQSRLLQDLRSLAVTPSKIVYLGAQRDETEADAAATFLHLCSFLRALARFGVTLPTTITVATREVAPVLGTESGLPEHWMLSGLLQASTVELQQVTCRMVDLESSSELAACQRAAQALIRSSSTDELPLHLAVRGRRWWSRSFRTVTHGREDVEAFRSRLRDGVCIVTGGLGGVGYTLTQELLQHTQLGLALIQRNPMADGGAGASALRAQRCTELSRQARVRTYTADVADGLALEAVIRQIREELGPIRGVLHCAGVPGSGMLVNASRESVLRVLAPKVSGTRALLAAVAGDSPEFLVFCSSTAALLGGIGVADYAAANAFLDVTAERQRARGKPAYSINWDTWREVGMAVESGAVTSLKAYHEERLERGLSNAEAASAWWQILAAGPRNVAVANRGVAVLAAPTRAARDEAAAPLEDARQPVPRELIQSAYRAARTTIEELVIAGFERALGLHGIGIDDDFFELGGDSLTATQVVARLRERFGVDLAVANLLEGRTAESVAAYVELLLIEEATTTGEAAT